MFDTGQQRLLPIPPGCKNDISHILPGNFNIEDQSFDKIVVGKPLCPFNGDNGGSGVENVI